DITFSEEDDLEAIRPGLIWPFEIIRKGARPSRPVVVRSVAPVTGLPDTYRFTFDPASPAYPVYIDSLVLASAPLIHDALCNAGVAGGKTVPVEIGRASCREGG